MVEFISYKNFSDLVVYIAKKNSKNIYQELLHHSFPIQPLTAWEEVVTLGSGDTLFGSESETITVYDYSNIPVSKNALESISESDAIIIQREAGVIPTADKKIIKNHTSLIELKKPQLPDVQLLISDFKTSSGFNLNTSIANHIQKTGDNYDTMATLLYIAMVTDNSLQIVNEYNEKEIIGLFMLPWRLTNIKQDALRWLEATKPEEIQLALSLLMTKTLKWQQLHPRKWVVDRLIEADNQLKTFTRSDAVYFKSMLWEIANKPF
jgi:hypothetical protein